MVIDTKLLVNQAKVIAVNLLDTNGDGIITIADAVKKLKALGIKFVNFSLEEIVKQIDTDHDGKVYWEEVKAYVEKLMNEIKAYSKDKMSFKQWVETLKDKNNVYSSIFKWIAASILTTIGSLLVGFFTNQDYSIWSIVAGLFVLIVSFGQYTLLDKMKRSNDYELKAKDDTIANLNNSVNELKGANAQLTYKNQYLQDLLEAK